MFLSRQGGAGPLLQPACLREDMAKDPKLTVADPKARLGIAQFYGIYLFILLVVGLRVSQSNLSPRNPVCSRNPSLAGSSHPETYG